MKGQVTITEFDKSAKVDHPLFRKLMIAVSIPKDRRVDFDMSQYLNRQAIKYNANLAVTVCNWIIFSRNTIVQEFLKREELTHLFFCDADTIPPEDTIDKLFNLDVDVAGGIEPMNKANNILWSYQVEKEIVVHCGDPLPDKPIQVARVNGCPTLVKRKVYEAMEWPYYEMPHSEDGSFTGNDYHFCDKVNDLGFECWIDTSIKCSHINTVDLLPFALMMIPAETADV